MGALPFLLTPTDTTMEVDHAKAHRSACLRIVCSLLIVWFSVSYCCAILFRDWLDANAPHVGSAPFGFWMAQQGAIMVFVVLLVVYAVLMNRLDAKHGYSEGK
jgi:putative solute:sodium symporter small subunit